MATAKTYSTKQLSGTRVVGGKRGSKRIGKVDRFIFHPSEKRCVGFTVKRPDLLLMFHRKDLFVPLDGFSIEDGRIALPYGEKDMVDKGACRRLGLDWDSCVMWGSMPILTEGGEPCGTVGDITFDRNTGKVRSVVANKGATSKLLLGETLIPAAMIRGFKTGVGVALTGAETEGQDDEDVVLGAILVSDEVLSLQAEGGVAEKAGRDAAVVQDKARKAKAKAKPKVDAAGKATGEAINKGAYATGKQISKAKGMFSAFKEEYDKAVSDDDAPASKKK